MRSDLQAPSTQESQEKKKWVEPVAVLLKDKNGHRPANGGERKLQEDPHWRDYIQFSEYFQSDNGAGLGASHQTGWTGVVACAMHLFATTTADQVLTRGKHAAFIEVEPERRR